MVLLRLTDVRPDSEIKKAIDAVVADAEDRWEPAKFEGWYPLTGFGIEELAPFHLNAGGAGWGSSDFWAASIAASNTWQDWWNITMTDMAYVIDCGLFNREATPKLTHVRPNPGGEDFPAKNIEQMYTLDVARVFYEKPYSVSPNSPYVYRIKGDNTGVERVGLIGYAIARRAFLIVET